VQDGSYFSSAIAVDSWGQAYVCGFTSSPDFPTTPGAFQTTFNGLADDAFVTKLNSQGTGLVYSTFLGGTTENDATGIAIDGAGRAFVTGFTNSSDFPTTPGAFQSTSRGGYDAFVTKLNASGSALVYSTYLGGKLEDDGLSIAVDWSGNAYVTGNTFSQDFPTTPGSVQPAPGGGSDVFVTKLNASGSALMYSTYLGGTGADFSFGIAVDPSGEAHVAGYTNSMNFPVTADAYQSANAAALNDAFVTKFSSDGSALVYSTYLGGTMNNLGYGVGLGRADNVYVTGNTNSANFPTTPGAYDTLFNGGPIYGDAFVTKLEVPAGDSGRCHRGDGDGDAEEGSGRKSHYHFHKKSSCDTGGDDTENDNVESDDGSTSHFQSTAINSCTFTVADDKQMVTMIGTGLHNGLPVTFNVLAVNYGDVAPGVFSIAMSDGYTFAGSIVDGLIDIE
jgi:hypothetical protein